MLAESYEKQAQYLDALHAFQKAVELEPANESYRFDYIQELPLHQNFEAAVRVAEAARQDFPGSRKLSLRWRCAKTGMRTGPARPWQNARN